MLKSIDKIRLVVSCLLLAVLPLAVSAQAKQPNPTLAHNYNSVWFDNWVGLSNGMLRVAAPDGEVQTIFEESRSPVYRLTGTRVLDGMYRFELRAATSERIPAPRNKSVLSNDENQPETVAKPLYITGAFLVEGGAIKLPETNAEAETR